MQVKKQEIELRNETRDYFKIEKAVHHGCILSPCLFNIYAEYIMWNARLDESPAGIKMVGWNIDNLRYADNSTLIAENKEELKSLLMKVKKGNEKNSLKTQHSGKEDHGIQYHHFMTNRWGNNGKSERLFLGAAKSL